MRATEGRFLPIISIFFLIIYISNACAIRVALDEKGVPIVDYGFVSPLGGSSDTQKDGWVYIGEQRNQLTIASYAENYYSQYLNGNDSSKDLFVNCADWLIDNAKVRDDILVWEYNYSWPTYNNTAPWRSGMAQAKSIKVLAMAYNLTGAEKYIETARKGLKIFSTDIDKGGVTHKDKNGWWYEEYAQTGLDIQPRVLNGHISALLDLHEYYNYTKDERAKKLFDLGASDLKAFLKFYDTGNWSYYDACNNIAVFKYHDLHVKLLNSMYKTTADPYFKFYRDNWAYYELTTLQESLAKADIIISLYRMQQAEINKEINSIEAIISKENDTKLS